MRRSLLWGAAAIVALAVALGFGFMLTEGGLFTRARHEWTVELIPSGDGAWSVEVPRLVGGGTLPPLLAELRVAEGSASFELRPDALAIRGEGPATLTAVKTARQGTEGFADWRVSGMDAVSTSGSPPMEAVWRVDLSGGGGHTCWASGEWRATLEPGTPQTLFREQGPGGSGGRPWGVVCA